MNILVRPDPRLLEPAVQVRVFDAELRQLAQDMLDTMYAAGGCGLAAPQVGVGLRLIVFNYGVRSVGVNTQRVMANPRVVDHGTQSSTDVEGCLSCPGDKVLVRRWRMITVEWNDLSDPRPRRAKVRGHEARIVQHEVDHLDGILIA